MLLILLPFLAAQAQFDSTEEEQEVRRYSVEMIIFTYSEDVSSGTEIFPADEAPLRGLSPDESSASGSIERQTEPRRIRDLELASLPANDYTMGEIMRRLRRLDAYNPIMHFGWSQDTWPEEETRTIDLTSLARVPNGLSGELTLYLGRYLHLVLDLQLDAPATAGNNADSDRAISSYSDTRVLNDFSNRPGPVRYRIQENRILRSGELRYFDHPKFGVLAKAARVDIAVEEPAQTEETELLGYPPD